MISSPRRRRTTDRLIALGIALFVTIVGVTIYLNSDIRATTSVVGTKRTAPTPADAAPRSLTEKWSAGTDPRLGAAVSAAGIVATADEHTVTGHDSVTGVARWSYGRSNLPLCAFGIGGETSGVSGFAVLYEKNDFCSQVTLLDEATGARSEQRTSPLPAGGYLVFGGPYAGWLSPNLVEVWRNDLMRTIQYGDLPNPTQPGNNHLGCDFTDMALANTQFATLEHCADKGSHARVVLNFTDPGAAPGHPKGWDQFRYDARADFDTGSDAARIVGITADRVAVLVASPRPAVVVYDATGTETSRTTVPIPAAAIVAAAKAGGPTPAVRFGVQQFSLIGSYLLAVSSQEITVSAPATTLGTTAATTTTGTSKPAPAPKVKVADLQVDWTGTGAIGLPAALGGLLLMPVPTGLSVFDADTGPGSGGLSASVIPVDRSGYQGRVDASAVGRIIIEVRGDRVVALS